MPTAKPIYPTGRYTLSREEQHSFCEYPKTRIMEIVFVFPFMTVVIARKRVVLARMIPISKIMAPINALESSFMFADICVIAEKQNAEKAVKNTSVFFFRAECFS